MGGGRRRTGARDQHTYSDGVVRVLESESGVERSCQLARQLCFSFH